MCISHSKSFTLQEEYQREGIKWTNIEYTDNTECVQLFQVSNNFPENNWQKMLYSE